jgi:Nitroreductase
MKRHMLFLASTTFAAAQIFAQIEDVENAEKLSGEQNVATEEAAAPAVTPLPPPATQGGMPLQEALALRKSGRQYSDREISAETLSSMLWAGFGVSRPDGKRTAPTARNVQDIDIYVVKKDGAFRYDARANSLVLATPNDIRSLTATQDFAKRAPLNLLYVQTLKEQSQNLGADLTGGLHAGAISQNVGLFCASEGLENVVRLMFDAKALTQALGLPDNQRVLLTHTIGYAP